MTPNEPRAVPSPRIRDASRKSWSYSFAERVRHRRIVNWHLYRNELHVARSWAEAFRRKDLAPIPSNHAPWLNAEAIAYRNAIGREGPFL